MHAGHASLGIFFVSTGSKEGAEVDEVWEEEGATAKKTGAAPRITFFFETKMFLVKNLVGMSAQTQNRDVTKVPLHSDPQKRCKVPHTAVVFIELF